MPAILTRKGIWKSWDVQGDNVERLLCDRRSSSFCGGTIERATKDELRGLLSEQTAAGNRRQGCHLPPFYLAVVWTD